ncbi:MAG TPA: hypothetical protein VM639_24545 [Dongiaceae bacterium]|nr:hypothetical protein [Dongiaceae bacterium]
MTPITEQDRAAFEWKRWNDWRAICRQPLVPEDAFLAGFSAALAYARAEQKGRTTKLSGACKETWDEMKPMRDALSTVTAKASDEARDCALIRFTLDYCLHYAGEEPDPTEDQILATFNAQGQGQ